MCGEVEKWQYARTVQVRLTTNGNVTNVVLPKQFKNVQEIRLDETFFVAWNGGVTGSAYLRLRLNGASDAAVNSDNQPGLLIGVDVLNPQAIYQRPRTVCYCDNVSVNRFDISITNPAGTAAILFTEGIINLTLVMQKDPDMIAEYRKAAQQTETPQMKGIDGRSGFGAGVF
jgi:hypothetical protein